MTPLPLESVATQILALNDPSKPYQIKRQGNQIIGTWNVLDAEWYWLFSKNHAKKNYIIVINLDEGNHQFSYNDRLYDSNAEIQTTGDKISIGMNKDFFSGKQWSVDKELIFGFGIKNKNEPRKFFGFINFDFNTSALKAPILDILKNSGWTQNYLINTAKPFWNLNHILGITGAIIGVLTALTAIIISLRK